MDGGIVYLICENDDDTLYKIGVTKSDVQKRLKKLQTGNGNQLLCKHTFYSNRPYKLEKMLHNHFSQYRQEGEWFLLCKEQVGDFLSVCQHYQDIIDSLKDNPFF